MKDENPAVIFIPDNYKTGATFLGFEIKLFNVFQAIILASIPVIIDYLVIPSYFNISLTNSYLLSVTIFFSASFGYLGLIGVNDMTLGEFVYNYITYKKRQRKTYYNPRIKKEILTIFDEEETREELPREKIIALYNTYKEKFDEKNREAALKMEQNSLSEDEIVFFEDDYGVVDKPVEYMNPKEYKLYMKAQRKQRKQEEKQRKKEEKLKRKEERANKKSNERK